jgi:hypothetical protein
MNADQRQWKKKWFIGVDLRSSAAKYSLASSKDTINHA